MPREHTGHKKDPLRTTQEDSAAAAKSLQSCPTLCDPTEPTRLRCPWDSPGKNTGVGCHFLFQCMKVKREIEVAQSCLTLRDPMDCSLPDSSVHGILQARVLEWGAISFSKRGLYTWTTPDGQYRNQIDNILCSQRWRSSIQSAKIRLGADCGSDHELLIAKFRLQLKKVGKTLDHSGIT